MRLCIVGAGILGLAVAHRARLRDPDVSIVVLEKEDAVATHQTGRNSGVVHAGLYYEPGSLKARLCRQGSQLLREYCREHALPYEECGKVVVATEESELAPLAAIEQRAIANGVPGVTLVDAAGLRELEPHVRGIAALHSPHTAIVDYGAVAHSLAAGITAGGGQVRTGARVARVEDTGAGARVHLHGGEVVHADRVIVCAGLQGDRLAAASGAAADPRIVPFRGQYWALVASRRHLVRGLVYPVPDPGLPFLGVHLTRRIDGSVLVGPNAVLALAREGYGRGAFRTGDVADIARHAGAWRLFSRHWRTGVEEVGRSASGRLFVRAARRYVPELRRADVVPAPAGIRAQAVDPSGVLVDDFRLEQAGHVVWVRNAPSPAATSSLAIADELLARLP